MRFMRGDGTPQYYECLVQEFCPQEVLLPSSSTRTGHLLDRKLRLLTLELHRAQEDLRSLDDHFVRSNTP